MTGERFDNFAKAITGGIASRPGVRNLGMALRNIGLICGVVGIIWYMTSDPPRQEGHQAGVAAPTSAPSGGSRPGKSPDVAVDESSDAPVRALDPSLSSAIGGSCGATEYALVDDGAGLLTYQAPSSRRGARAGDSCVASADDLPAAAVNAADPLGFCDRDPLGCVSGHGGPCVAGERGCVPYGAADPLARCDLSNACAVDPLNPSDPFAGAPGALDDPAVTAPDACGYAGGCDDPFGWNQPQDPFFGDGRGTNQVGGCPPGEIFC